MANSTRQLSIRISADGGTDVTNTFQQIGTAGQQAFQSIDDASAATSTNLDQLDKQLADSASGLTDLQRQINAAVGIGGGSTGSAADAANVFRYSAAAQAAQQAAAMQAAQEQFNSLLGVGGSGTGSAAASAAAFEEAAAAIQKEEAAMAALDAEARQLLERLDPLTAAQNRYAEGVDAASRLMAAGKINAEQYEAALAAEKAELTAVQGGLSGAGTGFSKFGFIAQEAGYQIGDFAVQVAAGSGVIRPLIEQGTQLLSVFGPWGAVIGAAGAVVGALTQSLWNESSASDDAKKASDALTTSLNAVDEITKQLAGDTSRNVDSLEAEARYHRDLAQAAIAEAQAKISLAQANAEAERAAAEYETQVNPEDTGASQRYAAALQQLKDIKAAQEDILLVNRKIAAEAEYGGQKMDGFAGQGSDNKDDYYTPPKPTSSRKTETKDIDDQTSALSGLLDKMQSEDDLLQATGQQRDQLARQREIDVAVTEAQADAERDYQAGLRDTEILTQQELDHVKDLAAAHYDLTDAQKKSEDAAKELGQVLQQSLKGSQSAAQELTGFLDQGLDRIGSDFTQLEVNGGAAFKGLQNIGDAVVSELTQEFYKLAIANPFENALDGGSRSTIYSLFDSLFNGNQGNAGASLGGAFGDALGDMIGHAATGGYVQVGESGPEKFYPDVSGLIAPAGMSLVPDNDNSANEAMWKAVDSSSASQPAAPPVQVNINNYGNDQATASTRQGPNNQQIIDVVIRAVSKDILSGGQTAKAIQSTYSLAKTPSIRRS